jgi:glycine cleavage system aminomethyltransferase T
LDETGLIGPKGEGIAAEAVLDRVAQRGAADDFNGGAVAEAHLEEAATDVGVAADGDDAPAAADAQVVEATGVDRTGMVARGKVAGLLHIAKHSDQ